MSIVSYQTEGSYKPAHIRDLLICILFLCKTKFVLLRKCWATTTVWMFVFLPNLYAEILIPKLMVLGCGTLGANQVMRKKYSWLGWVSFQRGCTELQSPIYHVRTYWEVGSPHPRGEPLPESSHNDTLIVDFQSPELWEINSWFL